MHPGRLILKNATANLVRGGATAAVALLLPHFLAHSLDPARFAAWSLILQIASYASFLDFGLQTAVARFVAHTPEAEEGGENTNLATLASTAFALLTGAALLALVVLSGVLAATPTIFPGVPVSLLPEFRSAAWLLVVSACVQLPLSTWTGVLIGLHRNEIPALAIGVSRAVGAAAAVLLVRYTHSLAALTACLATANLAGALVQGAAVRHLLPTLRIRWRAVCRRTAAALARTCAGLSVWVFGMLLVSGLDVTLVGHFRFSAVGVYSIAATLAMFFAGLNQSVTGALMTPLAALHARGRQQEIAALVLRVTRLSATANFALALLSLLAGRTVLKLWVGESYAAAAFPLLCVLAFAQSIRLALNPYAVALVAVGQQARSILPAMVEALLNLFVSLAGVIAFGPMGVAAGTLAGSCAGAAALVLHTVPRVRADLAISRRDLLRCGMVEPAGLLVPLAAACVAAYAAPSATAPLLVAGTAASALLTAALERKRREPISPEPLVLATP